MHKNSLLLLFIVTLLTVVSLCACNANDDAPVITEPSETTLPPETTTVPVTTTAPATTTAATTVQTTTQTPVTTAAPVTEPVNKKVTLDAEMDPLYAAQGFHYPSTALYIYSSKPENRATDADKNALSCKSSGTLDFCYDGDYLWYFCTINDTTMFGPDKEYVLTDHNPWQTDSIEVWYSFDGRRLLHVDVDAWGLRLFTDDNSTSVHFGEVVYRVRNDKENGVWYAEIGIPAKTETGVPLKSGDTVYIALQINDLMTDFEVDPSRTDNLAFNGGHYIVNFKTVVLP